MCFSIGTSKTINFPFVPNGKLLVLGVPVKIGKIQQKICIVMYTVPNGKLMVLGVQVKIGKIQQKICRVMYTVPNGKLMVLGVPVKIGKIQQKMYSYVYCPKWEINGFRCPSI